MIEIMSADKATEILRNEGVRISPETVRLGIQQGVFPFGDCVMKDGRISWCYIYANKLEKWIRDKTK